MHLSIITSLFKFVFSFKGGMAWGNCLSHCPIPRIFPAQSKKLVTELGSGAQLASESGELVLTCPALKPDSLASNLKLLESLV